MQKNSGLKTALRKLPLLQAAFQKAKTSADIRPALEDQGAAEKLCVAVDENQVAFGNSKTCRYLAGARIASCRGFFLVSRNAENGAVLHLTADTDERTLPKFLRRVAGREKALDIYIYGGDAPCDFGNKKTFEKFRKGRFKNETAQEIEETLKIIKLASITGNIKITYRAICIFDEKPTPNAVIDLKTGEFFFVSDEVIAPYILKPHNQDVTADDDDFDAPDTGFPLDVIFGA